MKLRKKVRKRKNPRDEQSLEERAIEILGPNIEYIDKGAESEVYGNKKLVVKVYLYDKFSTFPIYADRFLTLSDANLIPKIHEIREDYIIMDRIYGKPLTWKFVETLSMKQKEYIFKQIEKLIKEYHNVKLVHGDLENYQNILVDDKLKVHFIDPLALSLDRDMLDYDKYVLKKIKNHLNLD